jgi:spermidine/putrescine transport system substrate-binding protein
MSASRQPSSEELESALARYLVEHRMSRRQLLERVARLGPAVALGPILAACGTSIASGAPSASASPTSAPASSSAASVSAPPSASPSPSATPAPTPEGELFVYNWDSYIGEHTVDQFQQKYGIKVTYDKFPDADTQITKIRSDGKGGGYDITYPTSTEIPSLATVGVIAALDLSLIPNVRNLAPEWTSPAYDAGNAHSIPNYWWTTGFAWDPAKIADDLSDWTALWDERYKGHIGMLDDQREVFAVAGFRLGLDPNTTSEADLDNMLQLLEQQKPLLRKYTDDDIGDVTTGQLWISHAWSGDWYQMIADKPAIKYVIPAVGAVRGSDTMVVLSGAQHPIAAHLWIDFNLDPEVSAANSNYIGYMGPNAAAQAFITPDIRDDPRLNPPADVQAKLIELLFMPSADLDKYTRRWNQLRA